MKDERPSALDERSQQAFEEAGFELESRSTEVPVRIVGILAIHGAPSPIAEIDLEDVDTTDSDGPITELVTRWENLAPRQLLKEHRQLALDPYVGVGDWVVPIDHNRIRAWVDGQYMQTTLPAPPELESRQIQIKQLRIVYIGRNKAVATYHVTERYKGSSKVNSGNAGVFLVHLKKKGWRIATYTKDPSVGI